MKHSPSSLERFQYVAREYTQDDEQEDEEDAEAELQVEEQPEDEEERDEDAALKEHKPWGETRHYCPVALKEQGVLWPGNPDLAGKYREKVYQFSTQGAKEKFIREPKIYLPGDSRIQLPPQRLLMLGARGAGKTERGRTLAKELGIFHIDFRERLQEMIIDKTGKRIDEEDDDEEGDSKSPKPVLTEQEEEIKSYLADDKPLPEQLLISIVKPWWDEEPFKSTGFVLEGCPHNPEETHAMAGAGLFCDLAVMLTVQEKDVINRLLPGRVARWKAKRDERVAKRAKERKERIKVKVWREADVIHVVIIDVNGTFLCVGKGT